MSNIKYTKAYDSVKKIWVEPQDIEPCDRYDKPRFYSENIDENGVDSGEILTYRKQTREIKFRKPELHPGETGYTRRECFSTIGKNTKEFRDKIEKQVKTQESLVHKIAKEVGKNIHYIHIPSVCTELLGNEIELIPAQVVEVKYIKSEYTDKETGRRADILFEATISGIKQPLFVEIYYKHIVDQEKKKQLKENCINCIEVDISNLRDSLELSERALSKKIEYEIIHNAYWISSSYKEHFNIERDKIIIDCNNSVKIGDYPLLRNTYRETDFGKRFFMFLNDYEHVSGATCTANIIKNINISTCAGCNRCIFIKNQSSNNIEDVHIYCLKMKSTSNDKMDIIAMENYIKKNAINAILNNKE